MDKENEGIEELACNKSQQLYARMVSWEFSNPDAHQPVLKRKRRKSKKNSQSGEVEQGETTQEDIINDLVKLSTGSDTESEDSEYFSAEEILSDSDSELEESASQMSHQDSEGTSDFDSVFESAEVSECSGSINSSLSQHQHFVTRNRARSKKQKRKRKKYFGDDFCFPFSGLENMDIDFRSLKDDVRLQGGEILVNKQVPSLVELCIIASQKLDNKIISQCLSVNVKKLMQHPIAKIKLQKLQFSWLFRLLSHCEPRSVYQKQFLLDKGKYISWNSPPVWKRLCPVGNVFNSRMFLKYLCDDNLKGNIGSAYVPFHCVLLIKNSSFPFTVIGNDHDTAVQIYYRSLFLHSAVAMVINLMLPLSTRLQSTKKQSGNSEADMLENILLKRLTWMKYVMKKRFPTVTEHVFDKMLPYALWARGDFTWAVHQFLNLAEKETRDRHCAMYLYEIGRMNLHFQEPEVAITYFRRAADAALQKQKNQQPQLVEDVDLQTAMLIADAHDQGVLTPVKAQQAASAWQQAVTSPRSRRFVGIGMYAVDSLLCYHSYSNKDDMVGWLDDVIRRLEEISRMHSDVYLYLSMVHAWKGDDLSSTDAYKKFVYLTGDEDKAPGQSLKGIDKPSRRRTFSPWQKLADTVMNLKQPKPLQVLWRTRLLAPNFGQKDAKVGSYSWDADIRGRHLYLHVNDAGYLTGDLQMLLPPINQVQLDLYSGSICFPSVPGDSFHPNLSIGTTLVPVPVELYRDKCGNTVHQVATSLREVLEDKVIKPGGGNQFLIWTAADGKKTQINLTTKAKDVIYKYEEKKLETNITCEDKKVVKRSLEILKKCYNKNMQMNSDEIFRFAFNEVHPKVTTRKSYAQKQKTKKKPDVYSSKPFVACGSCGVLISSSTLVVPVVCNTSKEVTVLFFVDCSSRAAFAQPKVVLRPRALNFSNLYARYSFDLPLPLYEQFQFPYADLCSVYCSTSRRHVIYDRLGEEFDSVGDMLLEEAIFDHYPLIIKNCAIFINAEDRITSSCNGNISVATFFGKVYRIDTCAHVLLMATENGLKFAEGVSLLPLNINIAENPEPSLPNLLVDKDSALHFGVIGQKDLENKPCKLAAIAYENNLIMAEIPCSEEPESVDITLCIELLGHARDICFLSQHAGFLVSVTQHCKAFEWYREHLYQYSYQGDMLGILPCLGPGPRSFCSVMLPSNPDSDEGNQRDIKRHVYMRDGHGAIICVVPY